MTVLNSITLICGDGVCTIKLSLDAMRSPYSLTRLPDPQKKWRPKRKRLVWVGTPGDPFDPLGRATSPLSCSQTCSEGGHLLRALPTHSEQEVYSQPPANAAIAPYTYKCWGLEGHRSLSTDIPAR